MRTINGKSINRANDLLYYFKGNADAVFCHCMETLDLIYDMNKGKPFDEIKERIDLYQDVLWYVSQLRKEANLTQWQKCSYCDGSEAIHSDDCVFKMHQKSDSK